MTIDELEQDIHSRLSTVKGIRKIIATLNSEVPGLDPPDVFSHDTKAIYSLSWEFGINGISIDVGPDVDPENSVALFDDYKILYYPPSSIVYLLRALAPKLN